MNYIIVIEGQNIPVPEEIGASDENVKKALAPFYPDAANAMITRVTKDETVTVTVIKKAGTKGGRRKRRDDRTPLERLIACKGGMNPALELYRKFQALEGELGPEAALSLGSEIDRALDDGARQMEALQKAQTRLLKAAPLAAPALVTGF